MKSGKKEEIYNIIFNNTCNFTGLLAPDGILIEMNERALKFGGLYREQVVGQKFWDSPWWQVSKERRDQLKSTVKEAGKGKFIQYEVEAAGANSKVITMDFSIKPIKDKRGKVIYLLPEGRDITAKDELESHLIKTNELLKNTQKAAKIGSWRVDVDKMKTSMSEEVCKLLEIPVGTTMDVSKGIKFYREDFRPLIKNAVEAAIKDNKSYDLEAVVITANGKERWVRIIGYPRTENEELVALEGIFQDIDGAKRASQRHLESKKRFEKVFKNVNDLICLHKADGTYIEVSPSVKKITGYRPSELIGKRPHEFFHPEDRKHIKIEPQNPNQKGDESIQIEYRFRHKNGHYIWLLASVETTIDDRGEVAELITSSKDITSQVEITRALKEFKERYHLAIYGTNDGYWDWMDVTKDEEWWSPRFYELLGYENGEIPPSYKNFHKMLHPDDVEGFKAATEATLTSDDHFNVECRLKTKSGKYKWFRSRGLVIKDRQNKPRRMAGSISNISEQKQAETALKKSVKDFRELTESIKDPFFSLDENLVCNYWNEAAERMTGFKSGEAVGKSIFELLPGIGKPGLEKELEKVLDTKNPEIIETDLTDKDKIRYLKLHSYPSASGVSVIVKDVTDAKEAEGKIKELNQNLEKKVAKRTSQLVETNRSLSLEVKEHKETEKQLKQSLAELKEAKETAESASKAKTRFLANISHEIRTPLNAIIGLGHLVSKTDLKPKQQEYFAKILSSSKALLYVINDILDVTKIESEKLMLEETEFDLEEVLQRLADGNTFLAETKGLELIIGIDRNVPTKLIGDPERLGQILNKLCNNAIKFTEIGEVSIKVRLAECKNDQANIEFTVSDTGVGMKRNFLKNLFKSFNQEDASVTRKAGGAGLGLSIAKGLVDLMGGRIYASSQHEKGSQFYISIWFRKQKKQREIVPSIDLRHLKVLVTEDNESSRNVLENALKSFSFNVTASVSGKETLELLKHDESKKPQVILLDWKMPEMDGIQTAKKIREIPEISEIPIIMMCNNYAKEEVLIQKEKLGIEAVLVKPFRYSGLYNTIIQSVGNGNGSSQYNKAQAPAKSGLRKELVDCTILLVEDNDINQEIVLELLKEYGFNVEVANDGKEAVKKVFDSGVPSKYDLVLMDLQMPVMDGLEATMQIRNKKVYDSLPILAITADVVQGIREKCMEAGMEDYITKPIDPDNMVDIISRWLKPKPQNRSDNKSQAGKIDTTKGDSLKIPELDNVEVEDGLKRVSGNIRLYLKLLKQFLESNIEFGKELREKVASEKWEDSRRIVHSLKGTAGNLGMSSLHGTCKKVEEDLNGENKKKSQESIQELERELALVIKELKGALTSQTEEQKQSVSIQKAKKKIDRLYDLLRNQDAQALKLCEEIGPVEGFEAELEQVGKAIKRYDFDKALELLNEIKRSV